MQCYQNNLNHSDLNLAGKECVAKMTFSYENNGAVSCVWRIFLISLGTPSGGLNIETVDRQFLIETATYSLLTIVTVPKPTNTLK